MNNLFIKPMIILGNTITKKNLIILLFIMITSSISNLYMLLKYYPQDHISVVEYILYNFNSDVTIVFLYSLILMVLLYNFFKISRSRKIDIIKYKNRGVWSLQLFTSIVLLCFIFLSIYLFIYIFQSINIFSLSLEWNEFSISRWNMVWKLNQSILRVCFNNFLNLLFYFITLGSFFMLINFLSGSEIIAFFTGMGIILFDLMIFRGEIDGLYKFSLLGHVILGYNNKISNIQFNYLFWITQIFVFLLSSVMISYKISLIKEKGL